MYVVIINKVDLLGFYNHRGRILIEEVNLNRFVRISALLATSEELHHSYLTGHKLLPTSQLVTGFQRQDKF